MAWDVTVPDTYAASHINETSTKPAAAADRAAEIKKTKYQSLCQTHLFVPVAIETSGVFNHEAMEFLQDLRRQMEEETGDSKETAYLLQRISVMIQRGNATSFAGTFPPPHRVRAVPNMPLCIQIVAPIKKIKIIISHHGTEIEYKALRSTRMPLW